MHEVWSKGRKRAAFEGLCQVDSEEEEVAADNPEQEHGSSAQDRWTQERPRTGASASARHNKRLFFRTKGMKR